MTCGKWTKPISRSKASGSICIELLIPRVTPTLLTPATDRRGADVAWLYLWTFCSRLSAMRSSAKRFFCTALKATYNQEPRVLTVDKNAAYPKAIDELIAKKVLPQSVELRQKKYRRCWKSNDLSWQRNCPILQVVDQQAEWTLQHLIWLRVAQGLVVQSR